MTVSLNETNKQAFDCKFISSLEMQKRKERKSSIIKRKRKKRKKKKPQKDRIFTERERGEKKKY